jgi:hypothetical protein
MGGNVLAKGGDGADIRADQIDLSKGIKRSSLVRDFVELFSIIDSVYSSEYGETLWPPGQVKRLASSGKLFTGSSEHLFDPKIDDDEFVAHKPIVGDIDVTVPAEKLSNLYDVLSDMRGSHVFRDFSIQYLGKKESGEGKISGRATQIHAIFGYVPESGGPPVRIQVDFVSSPFEGGEPSEFTRFGKSSSWSDIKAGGVKGVFHKLLLRSLSTVLSMQRDSVWLTAGSPLSPPEKIKVSKISEPVRTRSFSVDRGLRISAEEQPVLVGGRKAFKKIEPKDSRYLTSPKDIFESIFGSPPVGNEMSQFRSFYGLLDLMNDHLDNDQILEVYSDFIDKLFGEGADQISAYDADLDRSAKDKALEAFRGKFGHLGRLDREIEQKKESFYSSYKTRTLESVKRKNARHLD